MRALFMFQIVLSIWAGGLTGRAAYREFMEHGFDSGFGWFCASLAASLVVQAGNLSATDVIRLLDRE
jgi:hypothetical protein